MIEIKWRFVFDSRERWFPVGVEEALRATKATVPINFPIEGLPRGGPSNRIDFPADMKPPNLPAVIYRRIVPGGELMWVQDWLFYAYNPKRYAGTGAHEGDWEFVQIGGYQRGTEFVPVLATLSQHKGGSQRCFWDRVKIEGGRPVAFVARDSHANYFQRGEILQDECDGKGRVIDDYEIRAFGRWHDWDGLWGNSTGQGRSPQSPARQGKRWRAPHEYHSSARFYTG